MISAVFRFYYTMLPHDTKIINNQRAIFNFWSLPVSKNIEDLFQA
jgi:hypothetical protein